MNTDLQKKRELRDKVKILQQELMRVSATSKSLSEERNKRKYVFENYHFSSLSFLDYIIIIISLSLYCFYF